MPAADPAGRVERRGGARVVPDPDMGERVLAVVQLSDRAADLARSTRRLRDAYS